MLIVRGFCVKINSFKGLVVGGRSCFYAFLRSRLGCGILGDDGEKFPFKMDNSLIRDVIGDVLQILRCDGKWAVVSLLHF